MLDFALVCSDTGAHVNATNNGAADGARVCMSEREWCVVVCVELLEWKGGRVLEECGGVGVGVGVWVCRRSLP